MNLSKSAELRLKVGNLFLAAIFSLVPTAMTIGFLGVHGYILCRGLDQRLEEVVKTDKAKDGLLFKQICLETNLEANYRYLIWIWIFITLPTWRWFYIWHYKRVIEGSHKLN